MQVRIDAVDLHYVEHGGVEHSGVEHSGVEHGDRVPLVALHGAGVDHRDLEAALEGVLDSAAGDLVPGDGYRRLYPDLPGMGASTATGVSGNADVVRVLAGFVDRVAGGAALVLGHSYGAYLARGLAALRPDAVLGLALVCPVGEGSDELPDHAVCEQDPAAYDELDASLHAGFDGYFVVRTRATARRYRDAVAPGVAAVDEDALERIFGDWAIDVGPAPVTVPSLVVAGRRDATAGWAGPLALLDRYPHAAAVVVEDAGHALLHERPQVVGPALADWLRRAGAVSDSRRR